MAVTSADFLSKYKIRYPVKNTSFHKQTDAYLSKIC